MKIFALPLAILFTATAHLSAQVTVEVTLEQDQFLPGEALVAAVRIVNRSGQTLHLGSDNTWLTFTVESRDGAVVLKKGEPDVTGEFTLNNASRGTKRTDLAPCFNLVQPGRYSIIATVVIKEWNQQITSKPRSFDIIHGTKLWEQEFGVPSAAGGAPEIRKYTLQQANYLRAQLMLYFRLTDSTGRVNKVFPLGPMLSFGQPDRQVDRLSSLHVLYQSGPHSFSYVLINPDGNILLRQTYDYNNSNRPRLQGDGQGNLSVKGGIRRVTPDDLPPPETAQSNATTSAP